jgi:hypothetical protein
LSSCTECDGGKRSRPETGTRRKPALTHPSHLTVPARHPSSLQKPQPHQGSRRRRNSQNLPSASSSIASGVLLLLLVCCWRWRHAGRQAVDGAACSSAPWPLRVTAASSGGGKTPVPAPLLLPLPSTTGPHHSSNSSTTHQPCSSRQSSGRSGPTWCTSRSTCRTAKVGGWGRALAAAVVPLLAALPSAPCV